MPLAKLFVEGALDVQVLVPILLGNPVPQQGGSKHSLRPRARNERRENTVAAGYLRDRDFDFDPPVDLSRPTVDAADNGIPFGWRWCRHEIENYLIDPAVISAAMGWTVPEVEGALRQAATKIRSYEAARWMIGFVRRDLPPHYELRTRPEGLNEIDLPPDLNPEAINAWALKSIEDHRKPIAAATDSTSAAKSIAAFEARFDDAFVGIAANTLLWFSGKDMLAGMAEWLIAKGVASPGAFRAALRDWFIANPIRVLDLLPEWRGMTEALRN